MTDKLTNEQIDRQTDKQRGKRPINFLCGKILYTLLMLLYCKILEDPNRARYSG